MSKQKLYDKVGLLGVEIDAITNAEAIDYIASRAGSKQPSCYVVKPYVEFLDKASGNKELTDLLNGAELAIADGVALTWAAAYLYAGRRTLIRFWLTLMKIILAPADLRWPLTDRAAGINFTLPLLETASSVKLRVFLIGDPTGGRDISMVADHIIKTLPELKIIGTLSGRDIASPRNKVSDRWLEQTAATIQEADPDLILVGMGFPLQERVCSYLSERSAHGVFIGEGGTFDYESFGGERRKAPAWTQKVGLEWLWRLALEPKRLIRQLALPRFVYRVWKSR